MAATILTPDSIVFGKLGFMKVTITIPTSVDGTSGAVCKFTMPRCMSVVWSAISSDFNGKTVELKASNDKTNYFALTVANQITSSGNKPVPAIECGYPDWQVSITGAPNAAVVVTVVGNQLGR